MFLPVALTIATVALTTAWIAAIASASQYTFLEFHSAGRSRGNTIAFVVLTGWIGAIYYWLTIKRQVEAHRDTTPTAPHA